MIQTKIVALVGGICPECQADYRAETLQFAASDLLQASQEMLKALGLSGVALQGGSIEYIGDYADRLRAAFLAVRAAVAKATSEKQETLSDAAERIRIERQQLAAVPDLLQALKAFLDTDTSLSEAYRLGEAAVAKLREKEV